MIILFIAASIMMWCIWFHEIGHLLYFKFVLKKNIVLNFKIEKGFFLYFSENRHHSKRMYLAGIILGAFPLCIGFDTLPLLWNIVLVAMYIGGCMYDIKEVLKL